jgi:phosphoribosylformylglycinamidine (FGAM) synthase-like enzyme
MLKITGSPDMCSRRWVWEQYDSLIGSNTAQIPGGDAGVVRIAEKKAIAVSADVTPRYVEADPFEGGKQAVAECWRNISAVGAEPIAVTDNLNFGNPERPEIMGQFVFALKGIGEACRALDFPIVSGNVSLYNETNGQAILPTPAIGGVGLLRDWTKMATVKFKTDGDAILLLGGHGGHMGQSIYLREVHGREDGAPPPVDLSKERRHGDFVRGLIKDGAVTAVHDISDGGLASAVIEMALASEFGATLDAMDHVQLYAEDQARYVLTCPAKEAAKLITQAHVKGIDVIRIGTVTTDATFRVGTTALAMSDLRKAHEGWFPEYMAG